jgi:hypothetical protein
MNDRAHSSLSNLHVRYNCAEKTALEPSNANQICPCVSVRVMAVLSAVSLCMNAAKQHVGSINQRHPCLYVLTFDIIS